MLSESMENVVKQTILYSFVLSQPFIFNGEATVVAKSFDKDSLAVSNHSKNSQPLQQELAVFPTNREVSEFNFIMRRDVNGLTQEQKRATKIDRNTDTQVLFSMERSLNKRELQKIERLAKKISTGMQSDDVRKIQHALSYFGYYEGQIDGIYGPLTEKAIHIAKEEHHLSLQTPIDIEAFSNMESGNDQNIRDKGSTHVLKEKKAQTKNKTGKSHQIKTMGFDQKNITDTARSLAGTPYVWGGTTPQGFDCSGFVQYVFKSQGMVIPRTVNEVYNFSITVSSPSVGDMVFFETYQPGPSHMGIYLGNNKFIHAGEARGVEIAELNGPYWKDKYIGAKRIEQ